MGWTAAGARRCPHKRCHSALIMEPFLPPGHAGGGAGGRAALSLPGLSPPGSMPVSSSELVLLSLDAHSVDWAQAGMMNVRREEWKLAAEAAAGWGTSVVSRACEGIPPSRALQSTTSTTILLLAGCSVYHC